MKDFGLPDTVTDHRSSATISDYDDDLQLAMASSLSMVPEEEQRRKEAEKISTPSDDDDLQLAMSVSLSMVPEEEQRRRREEEEELQQLLMLSILDHHAVTKQISNIIILCIIIKLL